LGSVGRAQCTRRAGFRRGERRRRKRYPSAAATAGDLARFSAGEPITARPVGYFEKTWKNVRKRPLLYALYVVICVLVGVVTGSNRNLRAKQAALETQTAAAEAAVELASPPPGVV
jgi:hypothetical protein